MSEVLVLKPKEVSELIAGIPGWRGMGKELVRIVKFKTYLDGLEFVYQLGKAAEAADHHPDITMNYKRVEVHFGTHSASGITELDIKMARKTNEILGKFKVDPTSED